MMRAAGVKEAVAAALQLAREDALGTLSIKMTAEATAPCR
jgi:hypothetical protein